MFFFKKNVLTTQQQIKTIKNPHSAPAVPTTHVKRMNKMTPKIFCMQGKKTPMSVPIRADFCPGLASASLAAGIVFE